MKNQYILMADMISSSLIDDKNLMKNFRKLVDHINKEHGPELLSPLTITLGDEFQGVCRSLPTAVKIIIDIEEQIIASGLQFKLRYVLNYGEIETPINKAIAYEMLGKGLTDARKAINDLKQKKHERFQIYIDDAEVADALNKSFFIFQSLADQWKMQDFDLVEAFIKERDYKIVADKTGKDVSLMWRREKSLQMKEYGYIKDLIYYLSKK